MNDCCLSDRKVTFLNSCPMHFYAYIQEPLLSDPIPVSKHMVFLWMKKISLRCLQDQPEQISREVWKESLTLLWSSMNLNPKKNSIKWAKYIDSEEQPNHLENVTSAWKNNDVVMLDAEEPGNRMDCRAMLGLPDINNNYGNRVVQSIDWSCPHMRPLLLHPSVTYVGIWGYSWYNSDKTQYRNVDFSCQQVPRVSIFYDFANYLIQQISHTFNTKLLN